MTTVPIIFVPFDGWIEKGSRSCSNHSGNTANNVTAEYWNNVTAEHWNRHDKMHGFSRIFRQRWLNFGACHKKFICINILYARIKRRDCFKQNEWSKTCRLPCTQRETCTNFQNDCLQGNTRERLVTPAFTLPRNAIISCLPKSLVVIAFFQSRRALKSHILSCRFSLIRVIWLPLEAANWRKINCCFIADLNNVLYCILSVIPVSYWSMVVFNASQSRSIFL